jgi:hypothetical protein
VRSNLELRSTRHHPLELGSLPQKIEETKEDHRTIARISPRTMRMTAKNSS